MVEYSEQQHPKEVILEVTNRCNLKCRHCHFHGLHASQRRPIGHMKRELWEKVLEELGSWQVPVTLFTHGAGEPLLYPALYDLLIRAKQFPNLSVGFMTNAMLLDREWVLKLVDLQLDFLALSIDGVVPETHDYFRVNANLRTIERNISVLIDEKIHRKSVRPYLSFNMVAYPKIIDQTDDYVRKWLPPANTVAIATFRPVGSRKLWGRETRFPFRPCPLLYDQMVISYDGQVGLCCEDIHMDVPLGSIHETSLKAIYNNSPRLIRYRRAHENNDIEKLPLCSNCNVWGGNIVLKRQKITLSDMLVEKTWTPAFQIYRKLGVKQ